MFPLCLCVSVAKSLRVLCYLCGLYGTKVNLLEALIDPAQPSNEP
jgi:hypothetical protein